MINGCFYHDKSNSPKVAIAVLAERCELFQQVKTYELKQIFSNENMSGALIGSNQTRSCYCSHLSSCSGSQCACRNAVSHFLSHEGETDLDGYIRENETYLKENISFPYLIILVQHSDFVVISSYSDNDFEIQRLDAGCYDIRYSKLI